MLEISWSSVCQNTRAHPLPDLEAICYLEECWRMFVAKGSSVWIIQILVLIIG